MDLIQEQKYFQAKKQVAKLKGFYIHLAVYLAVNVFIIADNFHDGESILNMDNYWTAIFWGIGLAFHGFTVFLPNFIFGKDWEERKIQQILNKK